jgi:hypothetical protein
MNFDMKHLWEWIAVGTVVGTLTQILPAIAAFLSVIWYAIRIWEYYKGKKNGNVRLD